MQAEADEQIAKEAEQEKAGADADKEMLNEDFSRPTALRIPLLSFQFPLRHPFHSFGFSFHSSAPLPHHLTPNHCDLLHFNLP